MKVASLSQGCSVTCAQNQNHMSTKQQLNTGSKLWAKNYTDADRSLQKVYCLSSLSFLACLGLVYTTAAFFTGKGMGAVKNFNKFI